MIRRLTDVFGRRRKASPDAPRDGRALVRPFRDVNATTRLRGPGRQTR